MWTLTSSWVCFASSPCTYSSLTDSSDISFTVFHRSQWESWWCIITFQTFLSICFLHWVLPWHRQLHVVNFPLTHWPKRCVRPQVQIQTISCSSTNLLATSTCLFQALPLFMCPELILLKNLPPWHFSSSCTNLLAALFLWLHPEFTCRLLLPIR